MHNPSLSLYDQPSVYDLAFRYRSFAVDCHAIASLIGKGRSPAETGIVDLGCGSGSYVTELANYGYSVRGVDISAKMISFARERARAIGSAKFLTADIKNVYLSGRIHLALCLFDTLSELSRSDAVRCLRNLMENLSPPPVVIIQVIDPEFVYARKVADWIVKTPTKRLVCQFETLEADWLACTRKERLLVNVLPRDGSVPSVKIEQTHDKSLWTHTKMLQIIADSGAWRVDVESLQDLRQAGFGQQTEDSVYVLRP